MTPSSFPRSGASTQPRANHTDEGKVVAAVQVKDTDKSFQDDHIAALQPKVRALEQRATGVEQEIAAALRADVTDAPPPPPKPGDQTINASAAVPGPNPGDPAYKNGAEATVAGSPSDNPPMTHTASLQLADTPPGYDASKLGFGPARDQAWKDYLNGMNADGSRRAFGEAPTALPRPEAVQDKNLRTIGAAGKQQGVSYAWGGNQSVDGPTKGHGEKGTEADTYQDWNRTGYDCGGLVRFSFHEGTGQDVFQRSDTLPGHPDVGTGTDRIDKSKWLTPLTDGGGGIHYNQLSNVAQAGDVLVFSENNSGHVPFQGDWKTEHTGIYVGNGWMINAPGSGQSVGMANLKLDGRLIDVLRPTP